MAIRTYAMKDRVNGVPVCEMCCLRVFSESTNVQMDGRSLTKQHYDCAVNACIVPGYEERQLRIIHPRTRDRTEMRRTWEGMNEASKVDAVHGILKNIRQARRGRYRTRDELFDDYGSDDEYDDDCDDDPYDD